MDSLTPKGAVVTLADDADLEVEISEERWREIEAAAILYYQGRFYPRLSTLTDAQYQRLEALTSASASGNMFGEGVRFDNNNELSMGAGFIPIYIGDKFFIYHFEL